MPDTVQLFFTLRLEGAQGPSGPTAPLDRAWMETQNSGYLSYAEVVFNG